MIKAKANLFRSLLVLPVVVLVAMAVALFGVGLRTAQPQEPQAAATQTTTTNIQVQDLGTLGDNYITSSAQDINDSGQVVGYSHRNDGYDHAFLYDGTMHDVGTLSGGGGSSFAYAINNSGKVVGSSQGHGFIYDSTNGMKDLNDLVPAWNYPDYPIEGATAINSDGKIAVYVPWLGFLLTPATTATPTTYEVQYFPTLENDSGYDYGYPSAADINDSGKAVGTEVWNWNEGGSATDWNGFLYDSESATPKMQDLGRGLSPTAINNSGKILMGSALYDSATQQMQNLGTVGDYYSSRARGINDWDQVVGSACKSLLHSGTDGYWYYDSCHGFLKESGQPMIDLNTLLPADSGWTIEGATAINSDGKIAATGSKAGLGTHALLLIPNSDIPPADSQAPYPPKITSPQNNTYSTTDSFSVSGSAEAASTVELFEGTTSKGTAKADSSSGAWSIALSGVSEGPHTYSAKATDAAGNTSSASTSLTVTVDKTAPTVSSVSPASGARKVARNTSVTATFSEKMLPEVFSSTSTAVKLVKHGTATPISATVSYNDSTKTVTITPSSRLAANTKYTVKLSPGVVDLAGNELAAYTWSFTTGST